jgi:hypothetical protein
MRQRRAASVRYRSTPRQPPVGPGVDLTFRLRNPYPCTTSWYAFTEAVLPCPQGTTTHRHSTCARISQNSDRANLVMPTLISGGPNIPDNILNAREEGRLVFFCGAGVSMTAGLPSFRELVEGVRDQLNTDFSDIERRLFERGDYDRVLGALEQRIVTPIRPIVESLLEPSMPESATHANLMQLSRSADGSGLRLVTTNIDRMFEGMVSKDLVIHTAPALPPPSRNRLWGLVYLHGRLGPHLDDLVLTSADFGRAYMVDGWASRFVARLFQNFTVLFVGYSISDVVMRYLVDGIAAARKSGDPFNPPYALVPSDPQALEATRGQWALANVEAIPYGCTGNDHRALYATIEAWTDLARSGLTGHKARLGALIQRCRSPIAKVDAEEFNWLVDERSGKVAATLKEAKGSVAALELLVESNILGRFMSVHSVPHGELNAFEREISSWIASFAAEPDLIEFLLTHGPLLHPTLRYAIERQAREPSVPEACRRVLACLASEAFVERTLGRRSMLSWQTALDAPLPRRDVVSAFAPVPVLRPGNWQWWRDTRRSRGEPDTLMTLDLVDVEVRVMTQPGLVDAALERCRQRSPTASTAEVLDELTTFLKEALEWYDYFEADSGGALLGGLRVRSVAGMALPLHSNEALEVLVHAIRDSFRAALQRDVSACDGSVARWCGLRQRLFYRLVLFAANTSPGRYARRAFELLTRSNSDLLWSSPAEPEVFAYLENAAGTLNAEDFGALLGAVAVPAIQDEDGVNERLERIMRSADSNGCRDRIPDDIRSRLRSTRGLEREEQPRHQRDIPASNASTQEVLAWFLGAEASRDESNDARRLFRALALRKPRSALRLAIRARSPERLPWFALAELLTQFSLQQLPPRYETLLLSWVERRLGDEDGIRAKAGTIAFFLQKFAEHQPGATDRLWKVWDPLWAVLVSAEGAPPSFQRALNDPAGRAVEVLRVYVVRDEAEGAKPVRPDVTQRLSKVLAASGAKGTLSKTVLASFAFALYRLDPDWTHQNIISFFDQPSLPDALSIWDGFLFYPEYDATLAAWVVDALHRVVERTVDSKDDLASSPRRFFVTLSIEHPAIVSETQARDMLLKFGAAGLVDALGALGHLLQVSDPDVLWRTRLSRWFQQCWPKDENKRSDEVTRYLAELVLLLHDAFPEAVDCIQNFLRPVEAPEAAVAPLVQLKDSRSDLVEGYPEAALQLLSRTVTPHARIQMDLDELLERLGAASPMLKRDRRYLQLERGS